MPVNTTTTVHGLVYANPINKGEQAKRRKRYGTGFPLGTKLSGGYFHRNSGVESARAEVTQILTTERGERVMLPNFGANLKKYLFEPIDHVTYNAIKNEVVTSISNYSNDIVILRLRVTPFAEGGSAIPGYRIQLRLKLLEEREAIFDVNVDIQ